MRLRTPSVRDLPEVCEDKWTPWLNAHVPNEYGEFETIEQLRRVHSFCPKHYIKEVECRKDDGSALFDYFKCDITGATCRNNGNCLTIYRASITAATTVTVLPYIVPL